MIQPNNANMEIHRYQDKKKSFIVICPLNSNLPILLYFETKAVD